MPDKNLLADWFRHAMNDLISARHLFEDLYPKQTEIAAYHSQQCAEKALKAFLLFNNLDPPKIHDLRKLCDLCKNIDNSFLELEAYCDRLYPFGSEIRYPNELAAEESIAKAAIDDAQKVYDFCVAKVTLIN
jgi:HEPN domain-containing protein